MTAGLEADALYPTGTIINFGHRSTKPTTESAIVDVLMARNVDWIIFDEHWGTFEKRLLIDNILKRILRMGSISVRNLQKQRLFATELLSHPDFTSFHRMDIGRRRTR